MTTSAESPPTVGQQLRQRREALDLTQGALANRLGITVTSISSAENDRAAIRRGKRSDWERELQLAAGTISRAYDHGDPIKPAGTTDEPPYADLTDAKEAAVWAMDLPEADRIEIIDAVRARREQQQNRQRRA